MEPANNPDVSTTLDATPPEPSKETGGVEVPLEVPTEPVVEPTEPAPAEPVKVEGQEPIPEPIPEPVQSNALPIPESFTGFMESADSILKGAGLDTKALMDSIAAAGGEITPEVHKIVSDKLGVAQANILAEGFKREIASASDAQNTANERIYEVVGGEEEWVKIAAWTKTPESGLTKEAAKDYNKMLAQGGVQAELAAKAIKEAYMASPGFVQEPNLMKGDESPNAVNTVEAISRASYVTDRKKAVRENNAVAVQELDTRAKYTMKEHAGLWRGNQFIDN